MSNNYTKLRRTPDSKRTSERLLNMRQTLAPLHAKRDDSSLMLATWNIRDFDSNKFKWGPRLPETFFYLAEMASCFDLIAIQEVNRDLDAFDELMYILGGKEWDYILTDVTEGTGGNGERMAFIYRRGKVSFRRVAGEIVLPDGQLIVASEKVKVPDDQTAADKVETKETKHQFARSPFMVTFQAGWFHFSLCTVHIYYGEAAGAALAQRVKEIEALVDFFADRQDKEARAERKKLKEAAGRNAAALEAAKAPLDIENYILLGDFNVVSPKHQTMEALQRRGF